MVRSKVSDMIRLEMTSADNPGLLQKMGQHGIVLYDIFNVTDLTVCFRCSKIYLKEIRKLTTKAGGSIQVRGVRGPGKLLYRLLRRPFLLGASVLLMILVFFVPSRVLFIEVKGNTEIPTNLILEGAEKSGICFGVSRRHIRSESVKNALLGEIPQLQWVGINTSGCVATIHVRERKTEQDSEQMSGVGSIIAGRDGIIRNCTVLSGTAVCREGDAVIAGQTLVSGYTDCGIMIKAVRAQAEITACTLHNLTAVTPVVADYRSAQTDIETRYSLRFGKKLINFYKDSGISDTTCVKMYSEDYLTLPGGFQLPVALVKQQCTYYSVTPQETLDPASVLEKYCGEYLRGHMQAGQILSQSTNIYNGDGAYTFDGNYICLEMIGQFVNEEIVDNDGQTD